MLEIIAFKDKHPIYENLRAAANSINYDKDLYIIGLDTVGSINHPWFKQKISEISNSGIKFLLYLEEPSAFDAKTPGSPHWLTQDKLPYNIICKIINNPLFCGFITHIPYTCGSVSEYNFPVFYLPLFSEKKNADVIKSRIESILDYSNPIRFLYWGTWHSEEKIKNKNQNRIVDSQEYGNRGGQIIDILINDFFSKSINCTFTMSYPTNNTFLKKQYPNKVNIIQSYLTQSEVDDIFYSHDILLLPANQVRSSSICYAMSFGIPCIVSNTWGFDSICFNNFNSIVINTNCCNSCREKGYPICIENLTSASNSITNLCEDRFLLENMSKNTYNYSDMNHSKEIYLSKLNKILSYTN